MIKGLFIKVSLILKEIGWFSGAKRSKVPLLPLCIKCCLMNEAILKTEGKQPLL